MFINGLKYACSTCIKGHRSSHCSHVDRPLFEIRKKGRPVTQCTFCRDLRKTKQVHIKCACTGDKKGVPSTTGTTLTTTTTTTTTTVDGQSVLIYPTTSACSDDVCKDKSQSTHGQKCTCPNSSNQSTSRKSSLSKKQPINTNDKSQSSYFQPQQSANVTQDASNQMDVIQDANLSLLAPLCTTTNNNNSPLAVKEENLSYSWALITSPPPSANSSTTLDLPSNDNNNFFSDMLVDNDDTTTNNLQQHLGFIFHKPTSSQRFLDGQPRVRRRRSTNQKRTLAANSTSVTPTNYSNNNTTRLPVNALMDQVLTIDTLHQDYHNLSTPPSSAVSPHQISSSASSAAAMEPMDVQFDYLTEQLEILSSSGTNNSRGYMDDLANADELTAILNNVLQKEDDNLSLPSSSSYTGSIVDPNHTINSNNNSPTTPSITTTTTTIKKKSISSPMPTIRSQCGSFVPQSMCCKPTGATGGESVVITITPLTNTTAATSPNTTIANNNNSMMMMLEDDQTQQKTTTRIVTCYCGAQCTCPGCLVHPGNFLLGNDPYSGLMMNPSSASSSCYGSDEEDMTSIYSKSNTNNFMSF